MSINKSLPTYEKYSQNYSINCGTYDKLIIMLFYRLSSTPFFYFLFLHQDFMTFKFIFKLNFLH